jgi:hypothetical protein
MHGVDQNQSLAYVALLQCKNRIRRYVDESTAGRDMKPQFLAVTLHEIFSWSFLMTRVFAIARTSLIAPMSALFALNQLRMLLIGYSVFIL